MKDLQTSILVAIATVVLAIFLQTPNHMGPLCALAGPKQPGAAGCFYCAKVKFPSTHDGISIITGLHHVFIVQRSSFHQHMMEFPSLHAYITDNLIFNKDIELP